ncbi:MAG: helix-turn-helix domain-containing protein [Antricoccus sp.]
MSNRQTKSSDDDSSAASPTAAEQVQPLPKSTAQPKSQPKPDQAVPAQSSLIGKVDFMTVAEVAKVMRVSKMTVYRLVHSGELPAVRVGRSFRVRQSAVHDYLDGAFVETA